MQKLSHMQLHWGDPILGELEDQWKKLMGVLKQLPDVRHRPCLNPFPMLDEVELHVFCDESDGCGAVCYLRFTNGASVHCKFLSGKSRVAAAKALTIPRLELCAATVAIKLARMADRNLEFELPELTFGLNRPLLYNISEVPVSDFKRL